MGWIVGWAPAGCLGSTSTAQRRRPGLGCLSRDGGGRAELGMEAWSCGALRSDPAYLGEKDGQVVPAELVAGQEAWGKEGILLGTASTII